MKSTLSPTSFRSVLTIGRPALSKMKIDCPAFRPARGGFRRVKYDGVSNDLFELIRRFGYSRGIFSWTSFATIKITSSPTRNGSSGFATSSRRCFVLWGRYDTSFTVAGGEAYKKDDPRAEVHILDAGHFALDLKPKELISLTQDFMTRQGRGR